VGLFDGAHSRNFIYFNPKRDLVYIYARIQPREEWISRLEVSGVECGLSGQRRIWVTVRLASLQDDLQHIRPLLAEAVQQYESQ
jgi:hypothetical protein